MKATKINPATIRVGVVGDRFDEVVAQAAPEVITTKLEFKGNDNVTFEQTSEGMVVTVKGELLPRFHGGAMFSSEFMDYLGEHKVSGTAIDKMYEGAEEGLRRGLAIDIVMNSMKVKVA